MLNPGLLRWLRPAVASLGLLPAAPARAEFDLVPRAFRANPLLDLTVVTEATDEGRKRPTPTKDHPIRFALVTRAMQEAGRVDAGVKAPPPTLVTAALLPALAASGFVPADASHPPSVLIICDWGIYNQPSDVLSPEDIPGETSADASAGGLLNRAALVGGEAFSQELRLAFDLEHHLKLAMADQGIHEKMSPVQALRRKNPVLFDRLECEFYFVVATAFDFDSVERRQPVRLWRTKLTVDSAGVNLAQSLPALIASGAPYLGRETPRPVVVQRRIKEGKVELGPTIFSDTPVEPEVKRGP